MNCDKQISENIQINGFFCYNLGLDVWCINLDLIQEFRINHQDNSIHIWYVGSNNEDFGHEIPSEKNADFINVFSKYRAK